MPPTPDPPLLPSPPSRISPPTNITVNIVSELPIISGTSLDALLMTLHSQVSQDLEGNGPTVN